MSDDYQELFEWSLEGIQEIEDVLWDIVEGRLIDNAIGVQLDVLGALLGLPRNGLADELYRLFLRVIIKLNKSSGTTPEILEMIELLAGGTADIELVDSGPANFECNLSGEAIDDFVGTVVFELLKRAKPTAVRGVVTWIVVDPEESFAFAGGGGLGFSSVANPTIGGRLATARGTS